MRTNDGRSLSPAVSNVAGPTNYCWYDGKGRFMPVHRPGHIFMSKEEFASQVMDDYPMGVPLEVKGYAYTHGTGCAIGGDGFGWIELNDLGWSSRWPHIGHVYFGTDVELGSNVTIDRGAIGDTIIGQDVKIDNGVHIGHSAAIGAGTKLAAHAIIGGSARIGIRCWIGLGALIKQHVEIGNSVTIGMGAVVLENVPAGETWVGNPARKLR